MKTFHLDFNTALFRPETVAAWLHDLADLGFDTLLWEVENAFHWRSCPECAVPDTLPMEELRRLLELAAELGFENIPLLQTLGHCEYVLRSERYADLRENGCIDQYCPSNPAVLPFLETWIDETMEVFGSPQFFHVGADETMQLGACPECSRHAAAHGIAGLYRGHMDRVVELIIARGARPLLWADMFLSHPESLAGLSRDVLLCDWAYERNDNATQVYLFGHGKFPVEGAPQSAIAAFGDRLFRPDTDRGQLNPWVAADHLSAEGFDLLLCPASSHAGDAVFAPRTELHLRNIGDTVRYAEKIDAEGTILTSWTWHIFPWDLQRPLFVFYGKVGAGNSPDHNEFLDQYGRDRLALKNESFAQICRLLETPCPLTDVNQLGFYKGCINRRAGGLRDFLTGCQRADQLSPMIEQATVAEAAYLDAKAILDEAAGDQRDSNPEFAAWQLAADCLAVRSRSARNLLMRQARLAKSDETRLVEMERQLRARSLTALRQTVFPGRAEQMVSCQFDDVIEALENL